MREINIWKKRSADWHDGYGGGCIFGCIFVNLFSCNCSNLLFGIESSVFVFDSYKVSPAGWSTVFLSYFSRLQFCFELSWELSKKKKLKQKEVKEYSEVKYQLIFLLQKPCLVIPKISLLLWCSARYFHWNKSVPFILTNWLPYAISALQLELNARPYPPMNIY